MRRPVIGLLCGVMLLGMLACGAYALSGGDSLISLSYLTGTFVPKAVSTGNEAAEKALQGTYEESKKGLDNLHQGYLAQLAGEESGAYSATLQARDWSDGDEMTLTTGAGVMLMNGAASVSHDGAFIDVTDGIELASRGRLTSRTPLPGGREYCGQCNGPVRGGPVGAPGRLCPGRRQRGSDALL